MTDTELTTKLEELHVSLGNCHIEIEKNKANAAYLKGQIKEFEKELKRREKWAESMTNGNANTEPKNAA